MISYYDIMNATLVLFLLLNHIVKEGDNVPQLKLENVLDLNKWQALQDALAEITQLAIITIDYKGIPFSRHSKCTPFCQFVRSHEGLSKSCQKCDSRAGLEAVRSNRPYIYLCHYNIIDIAIPITLEDKYVGAVMAGQVRLAGDCETPDDLEQIFSALASTKALQDFAELKELYDQIPTLDYKRIEDVSNMLSLLCQYIVEEAADKGAILNMYERLVSNAEPRFAAEMPAVKMKKAKSILANALTSSYLDIQGIDLSCIGNKKLIPAFEYIYSNSSSILTLAEAAKLCHLSPSYFSRCFFKEVGLNYTAYVTQLKVEWAKQLLLGTDMSVTQVSDELGFGEPGYFIKIFKKCESVTPAIYRRFITGRA